LTTPLRRWIALSRRHLDRILGRPLPPSHIHLSYPDGNIHEESFGVKGTRLPKSLAHFSLRDEISRDALEGSCAALRISCENVIGVRSIPPEHNDGVRAGRNTILSSTQRSSERVGRIAVIVEDKVRMPVTFEPSRDLRALVGDSRSDRVLGTWAIVPGGGCGDVVFTSEPFTEFGVASPDVFAKSVPTSGFVLGEITTTFGKGRTA
jgi:hypothetical protein